MYLKRDPCFHNENVNFFLEPLPDLGVLERCAASVLKLPRAPPVPNPENQWSPHVRGNAKLGVSKPAKDPQMLVDGTFLPPNYPRPPARPSIGANWGTRPSCHSSPLRPLISPTLLFLFLPFPLPQPHYPPLFRPVLPLKYFWFQLKICLISTVTYIAL